jgi:hypothetical protein
VADLAGPPELLDPLQIAPRRLGGRLEVGTAAAGVGSLHRAELFGGGLAVADRLGPQAGQARVTGPGGPQRVQPLPGGLGGGADLAGNLGRVKAAAAAQLAAEVGVGDPVADQPPPSPAVSWWSPRPCCCTSRSPSRTARCCTSW